MNKKDLLTALENVTPGLSTNNKDIIEQSNSFVFTGKNIVTYNDDIAVSYPFKVGAKGAINSSELLKLLKNIKDIEVKIYEKKDELRIDGESFKSGISINKEIQLPMLDYSGLKFNNLPDNFVDGISSCIFSTAGTNAHPLLSNIHVKKDIIESCDNVRATRYKMSSNIKDILMIQKNAARHVINFGFTKYCKKDGWLHFTKPKGPILSSKIFYDKDYPSLDYSFKVKGNMVKLPIELLEILDRGSIFTSDDNDLVEVSLDGNECSIKGQNEAGWFVEKTKIRMRGKHSISFRISSNILKTILKLTQNAEFTNTTLLFKTKKFNHVVSLTEEED